MKMKQSMMLASAALLAVAVGITPACASSASTSSTTTAPTPFSCASTLVANWATPQLARETVVVSALSTSFGVMTQAAKDGFGGVLLYGDATPPHLAPTLRSLQTLTPQHLNLAVMTDDEGGGIIRVSGLTGTWPWAHVMGATMSPAQIAALARRVGLAMARAGITMDLAPVADVDGSAAYPGATNPVGLRSFGGNVQRDAADVVAFDQGLHSAGIIATVKHFPGLGGSSGNTDNGPAMTKAWSTLQSSDLRVFQAAIAAGVPAVMLSNAVIKGLTTAPSTLSPKAVAALRNLGFSGLIVTDSLGAGAIGSAHLSLAQASVLSIRAGADQLLGPYPASDQISIANAQAMAAGIVGAVNGHRIQRSALQAAAARVVATNTPQVCHLLPR